MSKGKKGQRVVKKKKNEKDKIDEINENYNESIKSKIFVVIGVLCFILAFYLLTLYLTNKGDTSTNNNETSQESDFSYTKILAGRSFSINNGEYLVVYYSEEDTSIEETINTYRANNEMPLYSVDMSDPLNTKYKSNESNTNPTKASEIKINGPTLIKFNGNNVEEYIEGTDNIVEYLS